MVFIFSTPLNLGLDSSWGYRKVYNITYTRVGNNINSLPMQVWLKPVWLLFKKSSRCFVLFALSDCQCERSLPHQSLLWSRWEDGGTPVLLYWHLTQYKTLWSLGWTRTSHTPTRMTDDKGPDNKQEEDNSWVVVLIKRQLRKEKNKWPVVSVSLDHWRKIYERNA